MLLPFDKNKFTNKSKGGDKYKEKRWGMIKEETMYVITHAV